MGKDGLVRLLKSRRAAEVAEGLECVRCMRRPAGDVVEGVRR